MLLAHTSSALSWNTLWSPLEHHAIRYAAIVVVGVPLLALLRRSRFRSIASRANTQRLRYALAGLILGGTWVWHDNEAPWLHAVRVLIVLLVLAPVLRWIRRRYMKKRRGANSAGRSRFGIPLKAWIAAKMALVGAGVGVEMLLEHWMSRNSAAMIVGAGIFLAVALGGPVFHRTILAARRSRADVAGAAP